MLNCSGGACAFPKMIELQCVLIGTTRENSYDSSPAHGEVIRSEERRNKDKRQDGSRTSVSKEEGEQGESTQGEWSIERGLC